VNHVLRPGRSTKGGKADTSSVINLRNRRKKGEHSSHSAMTPQKKSAGAFRPSNQEKKDTRLPALRQKGISGGGDYEFSEDSENKKMHFLLCNGGGGAALIGERRKKATVILAPTTRKKKGSCSLDRLATKRKKKRAGAEMGGPKKSILPLRGVRFVTLRLGEEGGGTTLRSPARKKSRCSASLGKVSSLAGKWTECVVLSGRGGKRVTLRLTRRGEKARLHLNLSIERGNTRRGSKEIKKRRKNRTARINFHVKEREKDIGEFGKAREIYAGKKRERDRSRIYIE